MINEDVTQRECNIAVRVGSITIAELRKALEKISKIRVKKKEKPQNQNAPPAKIKRGKQTLRQLQKQNEGLSSIELKDPNLRDLQKFMKKAHIDFSVVKDGKSMGYELKFINTINFAKSMKYNPLLCYYICISA